MSPVTLAYTHWIFNESVWVYHESFHLQQRKWKGGVIFTRTLHLFRTCVSKKKQMNSMWDNCQLTYVNVDFNDTDKKRIISCFEIQFLFRQIQLLLEQHAFVIQQRKKRPFNQADLKLSEDVLEDIKGLLIQFSSKIEDSKYLFQFDVVLFHHFLVPKHMRRTNYRLINQLVHSKKLHRLIIHLIQIQLFRFLELLGMTISN